MTLKFNFDQIGSTSAAAFFAPNAPAPLRNSRRTFFGLSATHGQQVDGAVTGGSWVQSFDTALGTHDDWDYYEDTAGFASVWNFGLAISGAARTTGLDGIGVQGSVANSVNTTVSANTITAGTFWRIKTLGSTNWNAICGTSGVTYAVGDYIRAANAATPATPAGTAVRLYTGWGAYFDAVRSYDDTGPVTGIEVDATQHGSSPATTGLAFGFWGRTPFKAFRLTEAIGLRIAGGSALGASSIIDGGLQFQNNGSAMAVGICFHFDAIAREGMADGGANPGTTGYARALALAPEQGLSWYSLTPSGAPGSGTQEEVFRLYSTVTDDTHRSALIVNDTGLIYRERISPGGNLVRFNYREDSTSTLVLDGGTVGQSPRIFVEGAAANIGLRFEPKGAGRLFVPIANVPNYADDTAAAAGGLAIGEIYRTGSAIKIRAA